MAATFYAQLLAAYRWDDISAAIAEAIRQLRMVLERQPDLVPSEGLMVKVAGITANAIIGTEDDDEIIGSVYLGSVMNHVPSGRFYAPWSPVSEAVRDKDARWWEALEKAGQHHGLVVANGEGDPTDIFIYRYEPIADPAELALLPDDIGAK